MKLYLTIDELVGLTNEQLIEATIKQDKLTALELELALRLEEYNATFGDFRQEPIH